MKIALFYTKQVGYQVHEWLIQNYPGDLAYVSFLPNEEIPQLTDIDWFILAWWPKILTPKELAIPKIGTLNFHNSLLPYNRGRNPNFWSLVNDTPYGVTLHLAKEEVDAGSIIAQTRIPKTWEDTGETLYNKGLSAVVNLFKTVYPVLRAGSQIYQHIPIYQKAKQSGDMERESTLDLEETYTVRDLLNLLRAKTFPPYPGCTFEEDGKHYHVRIKIEELHEKAS